MLVAAAMLTAVTVAGLTWPRAGETQGVAVTPFVWPVTGLPGQFITPIGAAPLSEPGEVLGLALADQVTTGEGRSNAMALVRQRGDGGWQFVSYARDRDNKLLPFSFGGTGPSFGRVTPRGGMVLALGANGGRIVVRPPNGELREIAQPDDALLAGKDLVGSGRVTFTAFDGDGRTGAYMVPIDAVEDRVLRFDGTSWTAEEIDVPGTPARFTVGSIVATDRGAWLAASDGTDGVTLFRRNPGAAGGPAWEEVPLIGVPAFAASADARPLTHPAEGLTATGDGLWLDGAVTEGGVEYTFTLHIAGDGRVQRSWCNAPGLCDAPLEFELSAAPEPDAEGDLPADDATQKLGYRSFAWPGGTFGTRVVTNPRVDGVADSGNFGTFDGTSFRRVRTIGRRSDSGLVRASGAFTDVNTGWLSQASTSVLRVAAIAPAPRLQAYPLPVRRPIKAVTGEPGRSPADPASAALAVGYDGQVLRFNPTQGWLPEPLQTGGGRATPQLNAVAWPELRRAHAVGEKGAMWLYRSELGLWERDEGAPLDASEDRFVGVAFEPGNPDRGYAVAQQGRILSYGKSWDTQTAPSVGELFGVAFAGRQALVVGANGLLVNDGGDWRVDEQVRDLLASTGGGALYAVAGLPDGGAVLAGDGILLKRDSGAAPWRVSEHPIAGIASAVSAVRENGVVRAIAILTPDRVVGLADDLEPVIDVPGEPPGIQRDRATRASGSVVRETAGGWVDDERTTFDINTYRDCPLIPEAAMGMALDERGEGWIVGGDPGRQSSTRCGLQNSGVTKVTRGAQTAQIWRYGAAPAAPPAIDRVQAVPAPNAARLVIGGHAQCEAACAELDNLAIGPDRFMSAAFDTAAALHAVAGGPRAFLYTGTRLAAGLDAGARDVELRRYVQLMSGVAGRVPTYVAPASTDAGQDAPAFRSAFSGLAAPQGSGAPAAAITPGGGEAGAGARTYFAFDTTGPEGTLRVIVVNNAAGSLEGSAPGQREWLAGELAGARARGVAAVVMGSRPLTGAGLRADDGSVASDGDEVARLLVAEGASAYLFDSPERNVSTRVPANAAEQIPAFGAGSLGYDQLIEQGTDALDPADNGLVVVEADLAARNPQTNRAPVSAHVVPVLEDLAVDAKDGVLVRRSSPALFSALGRRPRAGYRRASNNPNPMDPYVEVPNPICAAGQCADRVPTAYTFTSSNPEIGDFVRVDPAQAQANPRAVFLGPDDKPVADPTSGLFCAFNPGETTVSIVAGGLRYSTRVQVQAGSPRRPCGTRPVATREPAEAAAPPSEAAPPPVAAEAEANPTPAPPPPAPVVPPAVPAPPPVPTVLAVPVVAAVLPSLPPLPALPLTPPAPPSPLLVVPPPPIGSVARPSPPGGATVRVYEEKREEEEAFEQSSAAVRYEPDRAWSVPDAAFTLAVLIIAAGAGSTIAKRSRRRRTPELSYARVRDRRHTR